MCSTCTALPGLRRSRRPSCHLSMPTPRAAGFFAEPTCAVLFHSRVAHFIPRDSPLNTARYTTTRVRRRVVREVCVCLREPPAACGGWVFFNLPLFPSIWAPFNYTHPRVPVQALPYRGTGRSEKAALAREYVAEHRDVGVQVNI